MDSEAAQPGVVVADELLRIDSRLRDASKWDFEIVVDA